MRGARSVIFTCSHMDRGCIVLAGKPPYHSTGHPYPVYIKHLYNICTASAQRLRRWSNILQVFYKCFVFTGYSPFSSQGGDPRVVVSTAAFHARVRGSFPGLGGLKETKTFLLHPLVKLSIVGSLRDREVA